MKFLAHQAMHGWQVIRVEEPRTHLVAGTVDEISAVRIAVLLDRFGLEETAIPEEFRHVRAVWQDTCDRCGAHWPCDVALAAGAPED